MKNTIAIFFNGEEYTCSQFFDTDININGIDVRNASTNRHVGEMLNITIPDIEDFKETEKFNDAVEQWLITHI